MTELTGVLMTADLASIKPSNDGVSFLNKTNRDEEFGEGSEEERGKVSGINSEMAD